MSDVDLDFWRERWRSGQIGFHQNETNPHLRAFWPALGVAEGARVFVPLCGKSRDMLWLVGQGHPCLGVEISPVAAAAFFEENDLSAQRQPWGAFERWSHGDVELLCGDFFDLAPEHVAGCRAIFDRASLVALPPAPRRRYAEHMAQLFPEPVPSLLVTMEYPETQMQGPPFCVHEAEVHRLYDDRYEVRRQAVYDVLAEHPHLRERGITELVEKIYVLSPKAR